MKKPWEKTLPPLAVAPAVYWTLRAGMKLGFMTAVRSRIMGLENLPEASGCIIACTHLSHVEPMCVSGFVPRRIHWMARIEFYRHKPLAWFLRLNDAFPVNRFGVPVKAIRTAIERAADGKVVGMFPEGGVAIGPDSVCQGGPIKLGACLIACRACVPIIPCVILGASNLNRVAAWLPGARTPLALSFGKPIAPRDPAPGRAGARERKKQRAEMADELRAEFIRLYRDSKGGV